MIHGDHVPTEQTIYYYNVLTKINLDHQSETNKL